MKKTFQNSICFFSNLHTYQSHTIKVYLGITNHVISLYSYQKRIDKNVLTLRNIVTQLSLFWKGKEVGGTNAEYNCLLCDI